MEIREKIIERGGELILQYGVRTVTMDDISRDLSISKKTIYQYFKDKKDLINQITSFFLSIERERFGSVETECMDSVHSLMLISQCIRESMKDMKLNVLNDLQKFYPEAWNMYESFKKDTMLCSITRVILRGQEEGYFRPELDAELMAYIRMEQVQAIMLNHHSLPRDKYTLTEVQLQMFDHFAHGLFTIEGHQLYNQYTKEKLKENETLN